MHRNLIHVCLVLALSACGSLKPGKKRGGGATAPSSEDLIADKTPSSKESGDPAEISEEQGLSLHSKLRVKSSARMSQDLAVGLGLKESELCFELGNLSCFDEVHKIILGGVEAYELNIYSGTKEVSISMPMVVDRIVLAACEKRVNADYSGSGVIFKGSTEEAVKSLYQRAFLRNPTPDELAFSEDFAKQFESDPKKWALGQCFAVFSSAEFLFY